MPNSKINLPKIATASLAGVAGGVALGAAFPFGVAGLIAGSIVAAAVTGYSEYSREKRMQTHDNETHMSEYSDMVH